MAQTMNKMSEGENLNNKKLSSANNELLASIFEPKEEKSKKEKLANKGMQNLIEVLDDQDASARELELSRSILDNYLRQGGAGAADFAQKAVNKYKKSKGPEHEFTAEFDKVASLLKNAN
ncbi:MAG: hypothetical protein M1286_00690 [Candidatus Marsarchaeota archaeon]|nr:hypothetical protein [Candidatus Marsarchaeota archaeon]